MCDTLGNADERGKRGKLLLCDRISDTNTNRWPPSPEWISLCKQAIAYMTPDIASESEPATEIEPGPKDGCMSLVVLLALVLYMVALARRLVGRSCW